MVLLISINILWILYSCVDGLKDGFYWHFKSSSSSDVKYEIHPIFALQRGIVLTIIAALLYHKAGIYSPVSIISMMMMFSFFHNGTYYSTRNKLNKNIYKLGWSDQSTTSTAKLTNIMTYRNRTILMIVGILAQAFVYIFLMW